jgi:NOL1/NOP2/fmu family ribosome biogenesis protein
VDGSIVAGLWSSRFGVPLEVFDGYSFYRRAQGIWAFSGAHLPGLSYEAVGLRMISLKEKPWRPTTSALQVFGMHATKNVVRLQPDQARLFLAGESQALDADVEPGFVVVLSSGDILGCGLYSRGTLASQLPKERRIREGV